MLQCVRAGKVFCGLHVAHVHIICPVRDVTHVRKCTRPSPALPYCKRREAGRGPGNEATLSQLGSRLPSQNRALGVKVRLRDAVFYGFPYKLRPKLKIAFISLVH